MTKSGYSIEEKKEKKERRVVHKNGKLRSLTRTFKDNR